MADQANSVELATALTMAWLENPHTRATVDDVPAFLASMHQAVAALANPTEAPAESVERHEPKVSVRKSLASPDYIVSMLDGKPYRSLKRHLSSNGVTPAEYRERFGLKSDYPMVAPAYSEARRAMAKKLGLGRKPGQKAATGAPKGGRKPKSVTEAKAAAKSHLGS